MSREIRWEVLHSKKNERTATAIRMSGLYQSCRTLIGEDNHDCVYAMLRFIDSDELRKKLKINNNEDFDDERTLFSILKNSDIIDSSVDIEDFDYLYQNMDDAIEDNLVDFDEHQFMSRFNRIMTSLEVIPFDKSELPEATPVTL